METEAAKRKADEFELTNGEERKHIQPSAGRAQSNRTTESSLCSSVKSENLTPDEKDSTKTCKLEKYLEDIYQKHCRFSVDESEIEFVRSGVENLTLEYLQKTYRHSPCDDTKCKIKHYNEIELVKVGSFYEGTRNGFPDEFDFIVVLGTVDEEPGENTETHLRIGMCTHCEIYKSKEFPDASIEFVFTYGSRAHGPAELLEYKYKKGKEERTIDVDVVTALRCYKTEKYYTGKGIFNEGFYKEILKTGSFLFIYTGSSSSSVSQNASEIPADHITCQGPWDKAITETEKRFLRDILIPAHRKVYQLLKYIINGHFGEDLFKHLNVVSKFPFDCFVLSGTRFCISSYTIKVAVIHHHYKCTGGSKKLGDCVLDLLAYIMLAFEQDQRGVIMHSLLYIDQFGPCIVRGNFAFLANFYWCLRAFLNRLRSLKDNDGLNKCAHDLENSFMEMALRLDMFRGYVKYLSAMHIKYSDPRILWPERPKFDRLVKKVTEYNERRNAVPDCPWCDYPIFIIAHKRLL